MLDEDRNGVQPDVVTPGDLWGSPSFEPIIQFQNPPRRRPDPGPDARRYVVEPASVSTTVR
jgi:hypothetical protein